MPDIKSILASEIRRLAKKEVKTSLQPLQGQILALKKTISAQGAKIKTLEKCRSAAPKAKAEIVPVSDKPVRLSPERIIKLRQKLGLTQGQFATLLDSNTFSVSHWENGKATPREAFKRKIAALRGLGKRKLSKLLAEKSATSTPVKNKATAVAAAPKAKPASTKVKASSAPKTEVKPIKTATKQSVRKGAKVATVKTEVKAQVKAKAVSPKAERKPGKKAKKQGVAAAPASSQTEAPAVPNIVKTESEPAKQ